MNATVIPLKIPAAVPAARQPADHTPAEVPSQLPPYTAVIDGQRLRQLRRQHGLSREALAVAAGIGITTLTRLEGQPRPRCRARTLARIARVLKEDPETIAVTIRRGKSTAACAITRR